MCIHGSMGLYRKLHTPMLKKLFLIDLLYRYYCHFYHRFLEKKDYLVNLVQNTVQQLFPSSAPPEK